MTSVDRAAYQPSPARVALCALLSRQLFLRLYVGAIAVVAGSVLFMLLGAHWPPHNSIAFTGLGALLFLAVSVFAQRNPVRLKDGSEVSAEFLAHFLSAALLGPVAAYAVAAVGQFFSFESRQWLRNICFTASMAIAASAAAVAYWSLLSLLGYEDLLHYAIAGIAAGLAYQLVNYLLFVPVMWLRKGFGPLLLLRVGFIPFFPYHVFFLAISIGLVHSFERSDTQEFYLALTALPVAGLIYAFRKFNREKELVGSLERFSLQIASSMITALDLKDNYTAQHSAAVAQYSHDIARRIGLPEQLCGLAHISGLLHDLGKISVPDVILSGPQSLAEDDWKVVKAHPRAGRDILQNVTELNELGEVILHHHERYDGDGYPERLAGEQIPLLSRIVCIADSYSAMISDRPYRKRLTPEKAIENLSAEAGGQFDPQVLDAFLELLNEGGDTYRTSGATNFHIEFQKVQLLQQL
jgi:HD-GYP domain-containing protein (c-di-GMP phosphodiesterase class II)